LPAIGLDGQRSVDWLRAEEGADGVGDFRVRLEYRVHN
jgi:uncharacterized protein (DUF2384 family)